MVLVRHELHARAGRPELLREALRVGDPCSRHHAPSGEHSKLLARSGPHTLEMTDHEPHRADRRPPPPPAPPPNKPPRPGAPRAPRRAFPGHDDQIRPGPGLPPPRPRPRRARPGRSPG